MWSSLSLLFLVSLLSAQCLPHPGREPSVDRMRPFLEQVVAEPTHTGIIISSLRFQGEVQAWLIPEACKGQDPSSCREAHSLEHSLAPDPSNPHPPPGAPPSWSLSLTHPGPVSHSWVTDVGGVTLWCQRCQFDDASPAALGAAGAARTAGTAEAAVPLASFPLRGGAPRPQGAPTRRPCPFRSKAPHAEPAGAAGKKPLLVAVVLSDAVVPTSLPLQPPTLGSAFLLEGQSEGRAAAAAAARKLLQSPAPPSSCTLTVSGTAHTFDACPPVQYSNAAYQVFYSVSGGNGSVVLRGGMRVAAAGGWAGWGLGSSRMFGTQAAIVTDDPSSPLGASVAGYLMPDSYSASSINAARGTWELTDTAAALDNGDLVCVFTATLDQTLDSLTSPSVPYIWAVGPLSSSGSGDLLFHQDWGYGTVTITPSAPSPPPPLQPSPLPPSAPLPAPAPAPGPGGAPLPDAPAMAPAAAPAPALGGETLAPPQLTPRAEMQSRGGTFYGGVPTPPSSGTSPQECQQGGQNFAFCTLIPRVDLQLSWSVLDTPPTTPSSSSGSAPSTGSSDGQRRLQQASTQRVRLGLSGRGAVAGRGYVALGFPSSPGQMPSSNAFILKDCDACPSGALLEEYWLRGYSAVKETRLGLAEVEASRSPRWIALRVICGAPLRLLCPFADLPMHAVLAVQVEVEVGPSPFPLIFAVGPLSSGGSPLDHGSGYASTSIVLEGGAVGEVDSGGGNTQQLKTAHAWLMTISWGVFIPAGIVMARNFKELNPLWFHVHRVVQTFAFLMSIAGLLVGFAIRGWTWGTPYPVHRNLGIAVMALGTAQITALVARPSPTHPLRRYWNWSHWWVGRAAAACAIANIYYGIINVDQLGAWAWAAYTAVLGTIVAVAVFKEGWDLWQRRRTAAAAGKTPQFATSSAEVEGGKGLKAVAV